MPKLTSRVIGKLQPGKRPFNVPDSELKGFIVRVEPSGRMFYYARLRVNGRQTQIKIGDAALLVPGEARDRARKLLVAASDGVDPMAEKRLRKQTIEEFLKTVYVPMVLDRHKMGVRTAKRLRVCFSEFLDRKVNDATLVNAILGWRAKRLKGGTTPVTANRDIADLRAMLQWAADNSYVEANVLRKLRPLKVDKTPRVRYLDSEEEIRLWAALDAREERRRIERDTFNAWRRARGYEMFPDLRTVAYTDRLKPMVIAALNTGMRRGELFGLEWGDIAFDRAMLIIRAEISKSGKARHIPLNRTVLECLTQWRAQSPHGGLLVFPGRGGKRLDNVNSSWRALMKAARIPGFRFHDMRHDFASRLVRAGVDLNTVRELLGHADLKMTLRYAHLSPGMTADAVAKLDNNVLEFPSADRARV